MLDFLIRRKENVENIKQDLICPHSDQILTRYTCSNGSIQYVMQCVNCHMRVSNPISHKSLSKDAKLAAPNFDERGREERRAAAQERFKMHREKFNSDAWWNEYNRYLDSFEWKSKRAQILIRDKYKCTEKRPGCTYHATEVHHLTYRNVGNEPLDDLTSVCHHCHEAITRDSHIEWRIL